MADGKHKNGVAITVTYQAVNEATGKTIKMDVYDEGHAIDAPKGVAAMTEFGSTGRYYGAFTPDAEGDWTVQIENTTDNNGAVVRFYPVGGHNIDGIGDDIAALNNLSAANVATELGTYDAATGAEVAALNDISTANVATELATYDAPTKAEMDTKIDALADITTTQVATELATYDAPTKAELDTSESNIRGVDSDTLKSLSDQIDIIGSPAMVG